MHARSIYRATLVSSATLASQALDAGAATIEDEESEHQGYWCQGLEFQGAEQYLQCRHFSPRTVDAPVYWNWREHD